MKLVWLSMALSTAAWRDLFMLCNQDKFFDLTFLYIVGRRDDCKAPPTEASYMFPGS